MKKTNLHRILFAAIAMAGSCLSAAAVEVTNWYVVGQYNNWSLDTAQELAYDEQSGTWKLHLDSFESSFKLVNQKDWHPQWGAPGSEKLTVGEPMALQYEETAEANNILINNAGTVTNADLVVAPAGDGYQLTLTGDYEVQELKWYVCGSFQGWDAANAPEMTLNSDTGKYELTVEKLTSGFKIINARGWGQGEWGAAVSTPLLVDQPLQLSDVNGGDIIFFYKEIENATLAMDPKEGMLTVSGTPGEMNYPELKLAGTITDPIWNLDASPKFTLNPETGIYTLTKEGLAACTLSAEGYEMKIVAPDWNPQWGTATPITEPCTVTLSRKLKADPANIQCNLTDIGEIKFDINTCEMTISAAGTTGIGTAFENDDNTPAKFYNLQGVEVKNPSKGIFILRKGTKAERVIME